MYIYIYIYIYISVKMKTFTLRKSLINLLLEMVGINTGMNLQFVSVISLLVIRILDIFSF